MKQNIMWTVSNIAVLINFVYVSEAVPQRCSMKKYSKNYENPYRE